MGSLTLIVVIGLYFLLLLALAWFTGRKADNESFFIGNRKSNWMLVAFGMVGTALSGVTFISVPGTVGSNGFGYMQVVIGNWIGFMLVAVVLLPLYYRLKLTSIYHYLDQRFGMAAHKTGAASFILSRTLGATARLYLVVSVLQLLVADTLGMPFWVTSAIILLMIWLYTFQGGVKTIIFTDTLQTACMLIGLLLCIYFLVDALGSNAFGSNAFGLNAFGSNAFGSNAVGPNTLGSPATLWQTASDKGYTRILNTDPSSAGFWVKQIVGGAFISLAMVGLDQEMMQKNISVPNLRDSQKNMFCFALVLLFVNVLFLLLGALLYLFAQTHNVTAVGDQIFAAVVMQHFPAWIQIIFFIALISALFPSADGALTALTSSFCIDILGIKQNVNLSEAQRKRIRQSVHIGFALLFFALVMVFRWLNDKSIIDTILKLAGYTYGPLLGLFAFGMFTKRRITSGVAIVAAAILAPTICYFLQRELARRPTGFQIGIELLLLNGFITFALLWAASKPDANTVSTEPKK
jgi:Na+/proline symporter